MAERILLTRGKYTLVDDDVYEWASQRKWKCDADRGRFHAARSEGVNGVQETVYLHREIMKLPHGSKANVDHINGDGLDNRRVNLRLTFNREYQRNRGKQKNNTSGYKGVYTYKSGKWRAVIQVNGKKIFIGIYDTPEDAARAYDNAALKHHGEFAKMNFPDKPAESES